MAAFKNKDNGTWYVQFRYTDWRGERQQKLKRGFATKKEALAWEREFLMEKQADVNMTFENFVSLYEKDIKPKLKRVSSKRRFCPTLPSGSCRRLRPRTSLTGRMKFAILQIFTESPYPRPI